MTAAVQAPQPASVRALRPVLNQYIPYPPEPRQQAALCCYELELLFGGAAGGGKTDYLLMAALQFAHCTDYSAVVFRRTFPQLSSNDGLLELAEEWLRPTNAQGGEAKSGVPTRWDFPSGARLTFSHMQELKDRFSHQGARYDFVGFDELGQFLRPQYTYLFSRVRRGTGSAIPPRVRSSANPGGVGHDWVQERWQIPRERRLDGLYRVTPDRLFLPSRLDDNPHLDRGEYIKSLSELDPVTRAQLLEGDWGVRHQGGMIQRGWFEVVESAPTSLVRCRYWDRAATVPKAGTDPDWTVGTLYGRKGHGESALYYVEHVERFRLGPAETRNRIVQQAKIDGKAVPVVLEVEPGSSGKSEFDTTQRLLASLGYTVVPDRPTGKKPVRAGPPATSAQNGQVRLVSGAWVQAWLDEAEAFPGEITGAHDDQVDSWSGAHAYVDRGVSWAELNADPGGTED